MVGIGTGLTHLIQKQTPRDLNVPKEQWPVVKRIATAWLGTFYDLSPVVMQNLTPAQLQELKEELTKASCRLNGWINFYDGSLKVLPILVAFITGMLCLIQTTVNKVNDTSEAEPTTLNISISTIIAAMAIINGVLISLVTWRRDTLLSYKQEAEGTLANINQINPDQLDEPQEERGLIENEEGNNKKCCCLPISNLFHSKVSPGNSSNIISNDGFSPEKKADDEEVKHNARRFSCNIL